MSSFPCDQFFENDDGSLDDATLITLFTIGLYSDLLTMIIGVTSLPCALILYKKASYDKI
jgi:hypothetical protein